MHIFTASATMALVTTLLVHAVAAGKKAPPGIPQYIYDQCKKELQTTAVNVIAPVGNNG